MRLLPDETTGKGWDQNVMQMNYGVLLVSQFTLYGFLKGNKPDFHVAMPPEKAKPFYASLVEKFQKAYNLFKYVDDQVFKKLGLEVKSQSRFETLRNFKSDKVLQPKRKPQGKIYIGHNMVWKDRFGDGIGKTIEIVDPVVVLRKLSSPAEAAT